MTNLGQFIFMLLALPAAGGHVGLIQKPKQPDGNSVSYPHLQIINRQIGIGQVPDLLR